MSDSSTSTSEALFAYIRAHARAEDAFLLELKEAAREAGFPKIWIAPEQAAYLQVHLRASGARRVLEVGTLAGYSAIAMARALPADGRLTTIELDPARAAFAREWIARSDVAEKVTVLTGTGLQHLQGFADRSADALFIDADKASYPQYFEQGLRILRPGGSILVDNAFAFGQLLDPAPTDPDVPAIRAFNELVARCERAESILVPLGDGMWVAVVR